MAWDVHNETFVEPEVHEQMSTAFAVRWVASYWSAPPGKVYAVNGEERISWDTETNWIKREPI